MSTRTFLSLLHSPQLAKLRDAAKQQRRLEALWQSVLPDGFTGLTRLVGIVDGDLVVSARSAAVVAKLRQMEWRMRGQLLEQGLQVSAIRWRIQAQWMPHEAPKKEKNLALSEMALKTLDAAMLELKPSPLKDALAELLAKRR